MVRSSDGMWWDLNGQAAGAISICARVEAPVVFGTKVPYLRTDIRCMITTVWTDDLATLQPDVARLSSMDIE